MPSYELILPDLGLDEQPVTVSLWLVERGSRVAEGDPVLEVLCGCATIDLPAPADGVLIAALVEEDDRLQVGQRLGVIASDAP